MLKSELLSKMKVHPFSVCVDGSNDTDLQKMSPITVWIHDGTKGLIVIQFLDMCLSSSSTAADLYKVIDGTLARLLDCENTWSLCTSVGIDNTSVNIGVRDSEVEDNKPEFCLFLWLPLPYYTQYCTKSRWSIYKFLWVWCWRFHCWSILLVWQVNKKNELKSYCQFCDQEYRKVIKHVSTWWLSLQLAVERSLKQFPSWNHASSPMMNHKHSLADWKGSLKIHSRKIIKCFWNLFYQHSPIWINFYKGWAPSLRW